MSINSNCWIKEVSLMSQNLIFMVFGFALFLLFIIIYLLRKDKIPMKYALVWIFSALIILIVLLTPNLMKTISSLLGFELLSNMLICLFIGILMFITLALTVMISTQKKKVTLLIQEISLLKKELRDKK